MKHKARAVFFDIDDTLYSTTDFARLARMNAARTMAKLGLKWPVKKIYAELMEVIQEFSSNYEHHFEKLILRIPEKYRRGINPAILISAAVVAYHHTKFTHLNPFPDVVPFLKFLKQRNIVRGIITEGLEVKQAEKLLRLGIYGYLSPNAIFISDQIGISKPNVKLYLRASQSISIPADRVMYIGNNPVTDIDPANKAGMITVKINRGGKYAKIVGQTSPAYTIKSLKELQNGGVF